MSRENQERVVPQRQRDRELQGGRVSWSDSRDGNWDGTKKGPLVSTTWRLLIGLADGVPVR